MASAGSGNEDMLDSIARPFQIGCSVLVLLVIALPVFGQDAGTTAWEDESLKLRLNYPSDLVKADPSAAMQDGHLTLLGISGDADPKLAAATRCLRPILLLKLPGPSDSMPVSSQPTSDGTKITIQRPAAASILLAELDINCMTPEQQVNAKDLLAEMADSVSRIPGMSSIANPSWYTIGYQKVHMAAAQGQPKAPGTPGNEQAFTMGLSTNWNNHLLVWFFSSNNISQLNRITKTTVRFGRGTAAPLYPLAINNGSAPSN